MEVLKGCCGWLCREREVWGCLGCIVRGNSMEVGQGAHANRGETWLKRKTSNFIDGDSMAEDYIGGIKGVGECPTFIERVVLHHSTLSKEVQGRRGLNPNSGGGPFNEGRGDSYHAFVIFFQSVG
jgi:hypothetical protein